MNNRVCVTGVGVISSVGCGRRTFWDSLINGASGITKISSFDTESFSAHLGGEVKDFEPSKFNIYQKHFGRCSQLAIAASQLAVEDAGLTHFRGTNTAVILGTTLGETQSIEAIDELWIKDESKIGPDLIRQYPANNIANNVSDFFCLSGRSFVIPNACAAGNFAISYAYELIRQGDYDVVLAGGSEAMSKIAFTGFHRIFAIAPDKCQPFDVNRKGIMVGEGSGVLILESEEHAFEREAKIYCYLKGYGLSADAKSMIIPDEEGIYNAMYSAILDAALDVGKIDYICAHGTGTKANDYAEAKAISRFFQTFPKNSGPSLKPLVTSIKSMLGHTMGAASAIESIACVLSIDKGVIPPTINLEKKDPECAVDVVGQAVEKKIGVVLNNAFGFGGNNSCVVFSKE